MKKIIICTMLLIISATMFAQQQNPITTLTKQDYLNKSRNQKSAAWCLMTGGLVSTGIGTIIALVQTAKTVGGLLVGEQPQPNLTGASILITLGTTAMVVSIPFFIAAGKNKRKAMSLSFKNETVPQLRNNNFVYGPVPSLNLKINL